MLNSEFRVGLIIIALVVVPLVSVSGSLSNSQAQRPIRQRGTSPRTRSRGKVDECHGKEIDKCYGTVLAYGKVNQPTDVIKTKEGIESLCNFFDGVAECQNTYIKKCATPIQKELSEFFLEPISKTIKEFCNTTEDKQKFLNYSSCLVDEVLETVNYKTHCLDKFIATIDYFNSTSRVTQDDRYDTGCCGFTQWQRCTKNFVTTACGKDAYEAFETYILNTFGGFIAQICPEHVFSPSSNICEKALPPASYKPKRKQGDNQIAQFISVYFGLLFGKAAK